MQTPIDQQAQRWLVCPERRPLADVRLFCLPYAGGGAAAYRPWLALIPPGVELNLVQLPGREARLRETPYTRIEPLVGDLAAAIAPQLDRPYAVFGHSMGALVGFELLRELRRRGAPPPAHFFVSSRRAPQLDDPHPLLHGLSEEQFVREIERRYNGIPAAIRNEPELMQLFLPTLRADFELLETYRYSDEAPLGCPIDAFGGQSDGLVSSAGLLAWHTQTDAGFGVRQLPGDHFYLQPQRAALLDEINDVLAAIAADRGAATWAR